MKETIKIADLASNPEPQLVTSIRTKQEVIYGDIAKIKQLLVNGITHINRHNPNHEPVHGLSLIQIKAMFGEQVAFIVEKVTNLDDKLRRVSSQDQENVYRIMNYGDERAAFVKLADRLHNMRTISGHSFLTKQQK